MPLISLLFLAALAAEPSASASAAAAPAASTPAKPPKPKKICVEEVRIGSLMTHRICATQEEWDRRQERDAAEMAKMRSVPNGQ